MRAVAAEGVGQGEPDCVNRAAVKRRLAGYCADSIGSKKLSHIPSFCMYRRTGDRASSKPGLESLTRFDAGTLAQKLTRRGKSEAVAAVEDRERRERGEAAIERVASCRGTFDGACNGALAMRLEMIDRLAQALAAMRGRAHEEQAGKRFGCAMRGEQPLLQGAMQPLGGARRSARGALRAPGSCSAASKRAWSCCRLSVLSRAAAPGTRRRARNCCSSTRCWARSSCPRRRAMVASGDTPAKRRSASAML